MYVYVEMTFLLPLTGPLVLDAMYRLIIMITTNHTWTEFTKEGAITSHLSIEDESIAGKMLQALLLDVAFTRSSKTSVKTSSEMKEIFSSNEKASKRGIFNFYS